MREHLFWSVYSLIALYVFWGLRMSAAWYRRASASKIVLDLLLMLLASVFWPVTLASRVLK
jgi:hypothetical protein